MVRALLVVFVIVSTGCKKEPPPAATLEPVSTRLLIDHLVGKQRALARERLGPETLWTDRALLERSTTLPASLVALLDASTVDAGVGEGAMAAMLLDLELKRSQWSPAKVTRAGQGELDCSVVHGAIEARVNCVYVNYLEVRYPKARFLVKGPVEPVLIVEGDVLRGALMPLKP